MEEQGQPTKRRGRPPKSAEDRKGGNLTFRVRDGMRERLEASAKARGVSISEDVEKRIERTFDFDYLLGDNETALVLRSIASAVQRFEKTSGKAWVRDSETQERVHEAVSKMIDVLLEVRPQIDDRRKHTGQGLPVDFADLEMRVGFRTMALDSAIEELQAYRRAKEQELIPLVREGRARRELKREEAKVRAILAQASRDELVQIAGSLINQEYDTGVRVARVQSGIVVAEQGPDGKFHPISAEWHGASPPPWTNDDEAGLRVRVEMMLSLPPESPLRPATPDELAGMVEAPGQLPPSIGDRAMFDDAVSGLPLVQAEKAAAKPRYTIQGALAHDRIRRKASAAADE